MLLGERIRTWVETRYLLEIQQDSFRKSYGALSQSDSMVSLSFRPLANYIAEDNFYGLQGFLENRRVQVDDRDENGTTALMVATTKGKLNFVRELLDHGADVNLEDFDNWTPLVSAAKEGYKEICGELLDHGANINHRDLGSWTAIMWASYKGRIETARLLMERGADVNAHGNFHVTSLSWAAGRGHVDIVRDLLQHGAKVNIGDKYGTNALVWAARKGYTEIVDALLKAGANVDTAGMYSWTPLLVATKGNYVDIVNMLLEHRPNVNALDKDGCTALMIACKEGCHEIAVALLNSGAYVNLQDRGGDTNLIHAAKAGHRAVVEALLKKYADVDIQGKDKKTALYWAVEKGNIGTVKQLLTANPDVEYATKDDDTPLMRAVRNRNVEVVQLLLDKKAKVSATDKNEDTALHIAMRARSKGIVEVLLRNPKNSQLLYRPNRAGETPYNIDMSYQKPILGQIFGARRLNTNEDNENMLGYDLYSSALADILSEPSLSMPITVGLYAKWGSGKSFLLSKLKDEMKNFARRWIDPSFHFSLLLLTIVLHIGLLLGVILGLASQNAVAGVCIGLGAVVLIYLFFFLVWYGSRRYDWYWTYNVGIYLGRQLNSLRLLLQVMFCHPPGAKWGDEMQAQPISFYFTDQTKVNNAARCENAVVQMIGSLYDSIENDYGVFVTRLYRAFRPKPVKSTSSWKWRRLCCLPYFVIFIFSFLCLLMGMVLLTMYLTDDNDEEFFIDPVSLQAILISTLLIVGVVIIANLYTLGQVVQSLLFSHRRHLQKAMGRLDTVKAEGYLQSLKGEVNLMIDMAKCLDAFAQQQTRLVVIVDGLDSCEQDKVLHVLDAVHNLFSDPKAPFIIIWNIDPHKIAKAIEQNLNKIFSDSNIGAHDYLRNMVHLPFYLQNSGLRKAKVAQQTALTCRKSMTTWTDTEDSVTNVTSGHLSGLSPRRSSVESNFGGYERPSLLSKKGKKLKISESLASSLGSNLNRAGGAHDLTKMLLTDDYFSDVNPRSMRRLMNVLYITGRLLKAFHIDFNWYRLASWVNITEQWPYRTSWIILYFETYEESLDDSMSLKALYDKIRPQIPVLKEIEPLVEMDRDERKFDILLSFHKSTLLVADLKIFLPFTINLDPYIRKSIKEEQQNMEEMGIVMTAPSVPVPSSVQSQWAPAAQSWADQKANLIRRQVMKPPQSGKPPPAAAIFSPTGNILYPAGPQMVMWPQQYGGVPGYDDPMMAPLQRQRLVGHGPTSLMLSPEVLEKRLATLSVEGICDIITRLEGINPLMMEKYCTALRENNVSGKVLLYCDMDELKKVLQMNFGDWELFRLLVVMLREQEISYLQSSEEPGGKNVRFAMPAHGSSDSGGVDKRVPEAEPKVRNSKPAREKTGHPEGPIRRVSRQNVLEKQVTLEEQMIIGALQTLNEEAFEDTRKKDEEDGVDGAAGSSISTLSPIQSDPEELDSDDGPTVELPMDSDGEVGVVYIHASPAHEVTLRANRLSLDHSASLAGSLPSVHDQSIATSSKPPHSPFANNAQPMAPGVNRGSMHGLAHSGSVKSVSGGGGAMSQRSGSFKGAPESFLRDKAKMHHPKGQRSRSPVRPSSLHVAEEGNVPGKGSEWQTKTPPLPSPSSPTPLLKKSKSRSISFSEDRMRTMEAASSPAAAKKSLLRSLDFGASFEKLHKIKQQLLHTVGGGNVNSSNVTPNDATSTTTFKFDTQTVDAGSDDSNDDGDETPLVSVSSSPVKPVPPGTRASGSDAPSLYGSANSTPVSPPKVQATFANEESNTAVKRKGSFKQTAAENSNFQPAPKQHVVDMPTVEYMSEASPLIRQNALDPGSRETTPVPQADGGDQANGKNDPETTV